MSRFDDTPSAGTLRWAVGQANAQPGLNTIKLAAGTYLLSLAGGGEDAAATGDLDVTDELIIVGAGAENTTIDAARLDRIFDVRPGAKLTLSGVTCQHGLAGQGGAVRNLGTLELDGCVLAENEASADGGALFNAGSLSLFASTITANTAAGQGGGLDQAAGASDVGSSTFSANTAAAGAGIAVAGGASLALTNSTLSGNTATGNGGGLDNEGTATVVNCTVHANAAAQGGGVNNGAGAASVLNSILAGNTAEVADPDASGSFQSRGHNLVGIVGAALGFAAAGDLVGTEASPIDPRLADLAANGGTTLTHALSAGSPAIDRGTSAGAPSMDQAGVLRPQDGDGDGSGEVDIGAVERYYGQIRGVKFDDVDGDSVRDAAEPGLSGWTIYLDENQNGQFDAGEPFRITDEQGGYEFAGLSPGNTYTVAEVAQDGRERTYPVDPGKGYLTYVTSYYQGGTDASGNVLDGLWQARGSAVSADGRSMYVTGGASNSLSVFSRDPRTGELTCVEVLENGLPDRNGATVSGLVDATAVLLSPDGRHVYVSQGLGLWTSPPDRSTAALAVFSRDPITGRLAFVEALLEDGADGEGNPVDGLYGVESFAISPDGLFLYAAGAGDDTLAVFRRDPQSGRLTTVELLRDGGLDGQGHLVDGLDGAYGAALSPDGSYLYVTAQMDSSVSVFARDPATGRLALIDRLGQWQYDSFGNYLDGLLGATAVCVSPDGGFIYLGGKSQLVDSPCIVTLQRDPESGRLRLVDTMADNFPDSQGTLADGLDFLTSLVVSPDGDQVLGTGAGDSAVVVLRRDRVSGRLFMGEALKNGQDDALGNPVEKMNAPQHVTLSPDGAYAYVTGGWLLGDGCEVFRRNACPPIAGTHVVQITASQSGQCYDFGDRTVQREIRGQVFNDFDGDGVKDPGESGLADWTIYLDANQDGCLNDGERWTKTLGDGTYAFTGLAAAEVYAVGQVPATDWPQTVPGAAGSGALEYGETLKNGAADALGNPVELPLPGRAAISPDGKHVYVEVADTTLGNLISVFARDPSSGKLTFVEAEDCDLSVSDVMWLGLSPDGAYAYGVADGGRSVAVFCRDAATGRLTFLEAIPSADPEAGSAPDIYSGPLLSPDGRSLYVTTDSGRSLGIFARDASTGRLTFVGSQATQFDSAEVNAVSPDGSYVYLQETSGLGNARCTIYRRDGATGLLVPVGSFEFDGRLVIAPDGKHAYGITRYGNCLPVFSRNLATGELTLVETLYDGRTDYWKRPIDGLEWPESLWVSPDGQNVYVAGKYDWSVAVFRTDSSTGRLAFLECLKQGQDDSAGTAADGLVVPRCVIVSPDGRDVYVTAGRSTTASFVTLFRRQVEAPLPGAHIIRMGFGQLIENVDFGNYYDVLGGTGLNGSITGAAFCDQNADGIRQSGETPVAGVTVFLDKNGDGQPQSNESPTTTAADGSYTLAGLEAGDWLVSAVAQADAVQTAPLGNQFTTTSLPGGSGPRAVATGDFNRDGWLDLAIADALNDKVSILWGTGPGQFQTSIGATLSVESQPCALVAAQLNDDNGDGRCDGKDWIDLAVAHFNSPHVRIYLNDGHGFPANPSDVAQGGTWPESMTAADLDGDGDQDLILSTEKENYQNVSSGQKNQIVILRNKGNGDFDSWQKQQAGLSPVATIAVQMNDDDGNGVIDDADDVDLAVVNFTSNNVLVMLNKGDGTFSIKTDKNTGTGALTTTGPWAITAGDFNHDGLPDLAVANAQTDNVAVFMGQGGGLLANPVTYAVGDGPSSISAGDFDGDGDLDLAVVNTNKSQVSLLRNRGDGTFGPSETLGGQGAFATSLPFTAVAADFDFDGDLDLAVTNGFTNQVTLLLNSTVAGAYLVSLSKSAPRAAGVDFGMHVTGPLADLKGSAFSVTPDVIPGGQTTVSYTITNAGEGAAAAFNVNIVLSDNNVIGDGDDIVVATRTCAGLAVQGMFSDSFLLTIPASARQAMYDWAKRDDPPSLALPHVSSSYDYLGVVIDSTGAVAESDETNNANQGRGADKDDTAYFPWDVNSSGQVTPTDAIFVINRLGQTVPSGDRRADPDGSGSVTPTDAIGVINRVGYQGNSSIGEASPTPTTAGSSGAPALAAPAIVSTAVRYDAQPAVRGVASSSGTSSLVVGFDTLDSDWPSLPRDTDLAATRSPAAEPAARGPCWHSSASRRPGIRSSGLASPAINRRPGLRMMACERLWSMRSISSVRARHRKAGSTWRPKRNRWSRI